MIYCTWETILAPLVVSSENNRLKKQVFLKTPAGTPVDQP